MNKPVNTYREDSEKPEKLGNPEKSAENEKSEIHHIQKFKLILPVSPRECI